jgi:hypothetical protein
MHFYIQSSCQLSIARHHGFIILIYQDISAKRNLRRAFWQPFKKGHMQPVVIYDPFGGFLRGGMVKINAV